MADVSRHDLPPRITSRSRTRVPKVALNCCSLKTTGRMDAHGDHDNILRHDHKLHVSWLVSRKLQSPVAMHRQISRLA